MNLRPLAIFVAAAWLIFPAFSGLVFVVYIFGYAMGLWT